VSTRKRRDRGHARAAAAHAAVDALLAIRRALRVAERGPAREADLPPAQLGALRVLADTPPRVGLSLGDLAGRLHVDPSAASVVVHRLVARGLAVRQEGTGDRRRVDIRTTAAGRRLAARAAWDTGRLHAAVTALDPTGVRRLRDALVRLRDELTREDGP
jgi:MarR family transcriptional regulator, organic hydroperoxide resistance regulator